MGSCGSWRKLAEKAVAGIKGALLDWDDILAFRLRGQSFSSYIRLRGRPLSGLLGLHSMARRAVRTVFTSSVHECDKQMSLFILFHRVELSP